MGGTWSAALCSPSTSRCRQRVTGRATRTAGAGTAAATNDSGLPRCARAHICNADGVHIRCLIVDDNQPFLDAARLLLERQGLAVVGVATTSADALRLEDELRPDVLLVDIRLGDESGFELARRLSGTVILISTHAQSQYAEQIAASPAAGFIPKAQLSASAVLRLAGGPID
jgi:CheY-like chemotaxis protein